MLTEKTTCSNDTNCEIQKEDSLRPEQLPLLAMSCLPPTQAFQSVSGECLTLSANRKNYLLE